MMRCDHCNEEYPENLQTNHCSKCIEYLRYQIEQLQKRQNESSPYAIQIDGADMKFHIKVPTKNSYFSTGHDTVHNYNWFTNQSMLKTFRGIPIYVSVTLNTYDDG